MKRAIIKFISLIVLLLFAIFIFLIISDKIYINDVQMVSYDNDEIVLSIDIKSTIPIFNGNKYCIITDNNKIPSVNDNNWILAQNNKCTISTKYSNHYLYIKDSWGNITNFNKANVIFTKDFETNAVKDVYMYLGMEYNLSSLNYYSLNKEISYDSDSSIINIDSNSVTALESGNALIKINNNNSLNVYVIDAIGKPILNNKRPHLTCEQFNYNEAKVIDEALKAKVLAAGEATRGAVIAVARFINLEFRYKVPYFFENGRLNNYEPFKHVDGEGRYYHKGLYLDSSKYDDLDASLVGPAMWGCELQNFTNWGPYIAGKKYPNGFDCSGFVSWVLYNAGFDMGDIGAGVDDDHLDFTDLGERVAITNNLLNSGRVKVGDLIGFNGHIAIIAGIDETNFYIAESLNTTDGVVITVVNKDKLINSMYKYIVLMDNYYKEDGLYTNMW